MKIDFQNTMSLEEQVMNVSLDILLRNGHELISMLLDEGNYSNLITRVTSASCAPAQEYANKYMEAIKDMDEALSWVATDEPFLFQWRKDILWFYETFRNTMNRPDNFYVPYNQHIKKVPKVAKLKEKSKWSKNANGKVVIRDENGRIIGEQG